MENEIGRGYRAVPARCFLMMLAALTACAPSGQKVATTTQPTAPTAVAELQREAAALMPLVEAKGTKRFLEATRDLPSIAPRKIQYDESRTHYYRNAELVALAESERAGLKERDLDEGFYYTTRYGTPLAYARPLDILAAAGLKDVAGKRILDYGYGGIGHLRLLASLGADAVGVEVDPLLPVLYGEPGDQGVIRGRGLRKGRVTLVHGQFPATDEVKRAVGGEYDLFISKNTLKNGYIHPAEPVDPKRLVHLGVDEETFVRTLHGILKPGGLVLIYNLCPAPAPPGKPYIPWADGRCPFPRAMWESAGFRVIEFDRDDSTAARRMGKALGWDQGEGAMDLENNLFAWYMLAEKRR